MGHSSVDHPIPLLLVLYVRLAKREESDMGKEFGQEYERYRKRTKMFIPYLF